MKILKNKWLYIALVLAAVIIFAAFNLGKKDKTQYFTAKVEKGDIREVVDATGTINAVTSVQVGSQVSGQIYRLHADFNSRVKKGQLIAEIEPSLFQGALQQATADQENAKANVAAVEANLAKTRATLAQTEADYKRQTALLKSGAQSQQTVEVSQANYEVAKSSMTAAGAAIEQAKAQVKQKEAAVAVARTNLEYTTIRSPIDGIVVARNVKAGYVKDDDAKDWKADELLASLKEGTEETNKERRQRGIGEIDVIGWVQPPTYDAITHRLLWSLSSKPKGATDTANAGINYNTYALGRDGYISLNLVTSLKNIERDRPVAHTLLAALNFNEGKRYADFNASTDKVAEYGLAALVAGVAAKKLGLLAAVGVFLLKFWKIALLALAGIGAVAGKFFGRKKSTDSHQPPTP